jgi:hypothetical protein
MTSIASTALGFAVGLTLALATTAIAQVRATVDTNGVLIGYIVQKDGRTVCQNPTVYNQFRGPESYIVCE